MSDVAETWTFVTEVGTLLSDSAGTFRDRSHQLQPLVLPQPSHT